MSADTGRVSEDTGLSQAEPSRNETRCPYPLTDHRAMVWLDGYQTALRWMKEVTR